MIANVANDLEHVRRGDRRSSVQTLMCGGANPWHSRAMRWWGRQRWVGPLVCAGLVLAGCNSAVDRAGGGGDPQPTVLRMVNPLFGLEAQPFVDAVTRLSHGSLRIDHQSQLAQG